MNSDMEQAYLDAIGSLHLWAAVLLQAMHDAQGHVKALEGADHSRYYFNRRTLITNQARDWFRSDRMDVGSFSWICGLFGLDPDAVRAAVLEGIRPEVPALRPALTIRHWRKEKGLTQKAMADKLGVSWQSIQHWEYGVCAPCAEVKERLAAILGN